MVVGQRHISFVDDCLHSHSRRFSAMEVIQFAKEIGTSLGSTSLHAESLHSQETPRLGIEPGSSAWRADILTTILPVHFGAR